MNDSNKGNEKEENEIDVRAETLRLYAGEVRRLKRIPTWTELKEVGVTRNTARYHFDTIYKLNEAAKEAYPDAFEGVYDESYFTPENYQKLIEVADKVERYVITTVVSGGKTHMGALASVRHYCKAKGARLFLMPCKTPATGGSQGRSHTSYNIPPELSNEMVCFADVPFNKNIYASGLKVSSKMLDPTTGTKKLATDRSFIIGSPKQRLVVAPNAHHKLPHVVMSPGTITLPDGLYTPDDEKAFNAFLSERTAYFANHDHQMGAIILECDRDGSYFFRQIQFDEEGRFVDLGEYWTPNGQTGIMRPSAFVLGDIHPGEHDERALAVWKEVCEALKPKIGVGHDTFSGESISHWTAKKRIHRAIQALEGMTLDSELDIARDVLTRIVSWFDNFAIVKSNHDDFLDRYLESGRFVNDPFNLPTALKLAQCLISKEDPFQIAMRDLMDAETFAKIKFLKRDEPFKIAGIECGQHGDRGPNGSRGNIKNLSDCYKAIITGHSHTPGIYRQSWQVGTSTHYTLDYNDGPSSWMQTSGLIYPNAHRQLINNINGRWRLD